MKIAVCSDIHLEFGDINLKNTENADVLVLGGDICVAADIGRPDPNNLAALGLSGLGGAALSKPAGLKACVLIPSGVVLLEFCAGLILGSLAIILLVIKYLSIEK